MLRSADEPNHGLRDFINLNQDPLPSIVVILAGTNDLAYIGKAQPIVECISALHKLCWDAGIQKTVAVGIPPSSYQENHLDAADLCCEVNEALKDFCRSSPRAFYVAFPFGCERDQKWAPDGLHLTKEGYKQLGTDLAPAISQVLKSK
jgi:lysophospholipase L1-like esterase